MTTKDKSASNRVSRGAQGGGVVIVGAGLAGLFAALKLAPRAAEIAARLAEALSDRFDARHLPAVEAAALSAARVERALGHLLDLDEPAIEEHFARLDDRARQWLKLFAETLDRLDLAPNAGVPSGETKILVIQAAFPGIGPADLIEVEAQPVRELPAGPEDEAA